VNVGAESLPEEILKRHLEIQESIRKKWLNGLSGEARNRLTPEERQFNLSYTILVKASDLEKASPGEGTKAPAVKKPAPKAEAPAPKAESAPAEPKPKAAKPEAAPKPPKAEKQPAAPKADAKPTPDKPVTPKDLEAAEIAFLKEREEKLKGSK
jgi:hypothetical protein